MGKPILCLGKYCFIILDLKLTINLNILKNNNDPTRLIYSSNKIVTYKSFSIFVFFKKRNTN